MIWRGIEGENTEERRGVMEGIMERVLGRTAGIKGIEERVGEAGSWVLIVEMEDIADKEELLERGWEVKRIWGFGVDEELTLEERKTRWRIVERARLEKAKGKRIETTNSYG